MLTLTCSPEAEPDPDEARRVLHQSWRRLRLRIARELAQAPGARWKREEKRPLSRRSRAIARVAPAQAPDKPRTLPYFAVVERHKSGRPHLHILLRAPFIPQWWLSSQMRELAKSPICDIRAVKGTKMAAAYVAKYIGKAPARFADARAYWYTANWAPSPQSDDIEGPQQKTWFSVRPRRFVETLDEIARYRPAVHVTVDGWFAFDPVQRIGVTSWHVGTYPPFRARPDGPE
jgi:hypothetical protein